MDKNFKYVLLVILIVSISCIFLYACHSKDSNPEFTKEYIIFEEKDVQNQDIKTEVISTIKANETTIPLVEVKGVKSFLESINTYILKYDTLENIALLEKENVKNINVVFKLYDFKEYYSFKKDNNLIYGDSYNINNSEEKSLFNLIKKDSKFKFSVKNLSEKDMEKIEDLANQAQKKLEIVEKNDSEHSNFGVSPVFHKYPDYESFIGFLVWSYTLNYGVE